MSELVCRRLAAFDETNLAAVRAAFQAAQALALAQAWRPAPEAEFLPGTVRTGWRDETLFVFAALNDADIFTRATRLNERTWELGDVFEIFLRPVDQESYVEFHITPNNQRLQLRIPSTADLRAAQRQQQIQPFLIGGDEILTAAWIRPDLRQWFALARIPAKMVCESARPLDGMAWRFSFSRYDYTRGRENPVISSTSPHGAPDFHSQAEWGIMRFQS